MNKKIIVIGIIISILLVISGIVYYCNVYDTNLVDLNEIKTDSEFENVIYNQEESLENDVLGILFIDKIGLKATVKEGSSSEILKNYIGHIENTATYDGNIGLAAHNRGNQYSYFARINELQNGDIITYQTKFYTRTYKVYNKQIILETNWSVLKDTEKNQLTLITCVANKKLQRLCVQATEIINKDL